MNVLQAPLHIVRRADAEPLLHPGVPGFGQVAHRQLSGEQLLLQLVAQHDVQRVGELVRIHADQSAPHPGEVAVDVLHVPLRSARAEVLRQQRLDVAHERPAAAHDHLDQQRVYRSKRAAHQQHAGDRSKLVIGGPQHDAAEHGRGHCR